MGYLIESLNAGEFWFLAHLVVLLVAALVLAGVGVKSLWSDDPPSAWSWYLPPLVVLASTAIGLTITSFGVMEWFVQDPAALASADEGLELSKDLVRSPVAIGLVGGGASALFATLAALGGGLSTWMRAEEGRETQAFPPLVAFGVCGVAAAALYGWHLFTIDPAASALPMPMPAMPIPLTLVGASLGVVLAGHHRARTHNTRDVDHLIATTCLVAIAAAGAAVFVHAFELLSTFDLLQSMSPENRSEFLSIQRDVAMFHLQVGVPAMAAAGVAGLVAVGSLGRRLLKIETWGRLVVAVGGTGAVLGALAYGLMQYQCVICATLPH